jgi:hypothetical protein
VEFAAEDEVVFDVDEDRPFEADFEGVGVRLYDCAVHRFAVKRR